MYKMNLHLKIKSILLEDDWVNKYSEKLELHSWTFYGRELKVGYSWVHLILIGREKEAASDLQRSEISTFNEFFVNFEFCL